MKEIFVVHVRLEDTTPAVWRRFEIRAERSFWDLHCAIQDAMGWDDKHLHEFRFAVGDAAMHIGIPMEEDEGKVLPGWETNLRDWFTLVPAHCLYLYDFGDDWEHAVTVESRRPAQVGGKYPRCTGGERACPPEDVGGVSGYSEFLEALADRRHSEHESYREWIGGAWDAEAFAPEAVVFSNPTTRLRRTGLA
jgi:hypothetical protein